MKDNMRDSSVSDCYLGHNNLEVLSHSHHFNDWIYEQILPGLKGDVLEVGSGIGTFSERIIRDLPESKITLTDASAYYVNLLEEKICNGNHKVSSNILDLNHREDYEKIGYDKFDTIIAINVLEHVKHDEFALHQLYKMLRTGGMLIILVPCYKFLYNAIDKDIGHFRRYTRSDIESKVRKTRFGLDRIFYFNMLGIVGWYINGNLARRSRISVTASKIFDRMVPLLKQVENVLGKKIGLSIICYLRKDSTHDREN